MTTAANIITASYNKIGIASPTAAQNASALICLNALLNIHGADFMAPFLVKEAFTLTVNDYEYTIGSGGNFDTVRPIKIENCYLRDSEGYDYALKPMSPRDYNRKHEKEATGKPEHFYFVPEYPLAKIILDYAPDYAYGAYFEFWKNITNFALSTTTVESLLLPPEYEPFLIYNLAVSLAEDWDRAVPQTVLLMALQTKQIIEKLNASVKTAPKSKFDIVMGEDIGQSNILTDEYIDGGYF